MSYKPKYASFIAESYSYDSTSGKAVFNYSFDNERTFSEEILLHPSGTYNKEVFDKVLQLAHVLIGLSYYKAFPTKVVKVKSFDVTVYSAHFFSTVYRDGLSQFVFENQLQPSDIAIFESSGSADDFTVHDYHGTGILSLQSGGKDSLLLATLLEHNGASYDAFYCSSGNTYPEILNTLKSDTLHVAKRSLDLAGLKRATEEGGLNGHVPITYIVLSIALLQAVLANKSTVLMAVGQEGEEPHAYIGDYAVRHQWSKTWTAEKLFAEYVQAVISPGIHVGSPLRGFSELKIAKLFSENCWQRYGHEFSSCNVANYVQGARNRTLQWCGNCSKCANSFLLFAPWISPDELHTIFGKNLFLAERLEQDFKGLLGIDNTLKPFECVGEVDELRLAYHLAHSRNAEYALPFTVPESDFDIDRKALSQAWAQELIV